jgi:hypothetical protein
MRNYSQVDVDENGRPDLLVGAVLSEEAVVLRSFEVIQIKPKSSAVTPLKAVNPEQGRKTITQIH